MTQTAPAGGVTDQVASPGARRRRRPSRNVVVVALVVLLLFAGSAVFTAWLVKGLLESSRAVQAHAAVAQGELQQFRDKLKAGDRPGAQGHLRVAKTALKQATTAAQEPEVRLAKNFPYVGATVSDLDHLLAAATIMTRSGDDALAVYEDFAGADSKLFSNSTFSLPAIRDAQEAVARIEADMNRAERELRAVEGKGPKGEQALEKKESALKQVATLRAELVALGPVLEALPSAVGAKERKTYLVTILNPAESRPSGGAPLSIAVVRFDKGRMTIPLRGQTETLTNLNQKLSWKAAPGDPWVRGKTPRSFVSANLNPDFPVAAEQLLRAAKPNFNVSPDGVIALDVVAISHLIAHTGPIESPVYGQLTADNVAEKLLVEAYTLDNTARHAANDALLTSMLSRLTEGGGMIGKARALGKGVPGRHLQMYFRDDRLQRLVSEERAAGEVRAPEVGNLTAVYTQNGNASKVDVFQRRTVRETVQLEADGSATVRRSVTIRNATPKYTGDGADPRKGVATRWAKIKVLTLMPPGAKITRQPSGVDRMGTPSTGVDQDKRTYGEVIVVIPPKETVTLTWDYTLPRAARPDGKGLRFLEYVETQPMLRDQQVRLTVVPPKGWTAKALVGDWKISPDAARLTMAAAERTLLKLKVSPAG